MATVAEHRVRVRYAETDQMGVAHHASYLAWFEEGRTEWLRQAGRSYRAIEEMGVFLAVTEVRITYRKPARYDDLLQVRTRLIAKGHASLRFGYAIIGPGAEAPIAEGETELACLDARGRLRRLPEDLPF